MYDGESPKIVIYLKIVQSDIADREDIGPTNFQGQLGWKLTPLGGTVPKQVKSSKVLAHTALVRVANCRLPKQRQTG